MNGLVHLSPAGEHFLANEEGKKLFVYDDAVYPTKPYKAGQIVKGHLTVGVGHLIKPGERFPYGEGVITEELVSELLHKDVKWAEDIIHKAVTVELNQNQYDALVSFVFNVGPGRGAKGKPGFVPGFTNSTLLRYLNAGEYELAAGHFADWHMGNGQPHLLSARRAREAALFRKPILKTAAPLLAEAAVKRAKAEASVAKVSAPALPPPPVVPSKPLLSSKALGSPKRQGKPQ